MRNQLLVALSLVSFVSLVLAACDTPTPVEHEKVVAPAGAAGATGDGSSTHGE